ncbi:MAG TPA: (2Fe-2S)-binding protein [Candidatus Krumholzibacteria bacterium]|nr:(2Fe-2S)-binding protein [Candidatus Krumholzibacteria bacterium]
MKHTLQVNGQRHTVDLPSEMPLLWVLRDALQLTGTRFGCGQGDCGACTVLIEGRPRRSCVTTLGEAEGKEILTIEGLAEETLHPVQRAWLEEQVSQCGACQSGMILAVVALLQGNPDPTDAEIDAKLGANLCRCGTYQRVRRAVHRAAQEAKR